MRTLCALLLLGLTSCGSSVDPAAAKTEVEQLVKTYHDAYDRGDIDAVLAMLDPEIAMSRPHENRFHYGLEACSEELKKDINRLKDQGRAGKRKTYFETIRVEVSGSIAIATYATLVKEDDKSTGGLFTRVFRHGSPNRWLIYREHY